MVRKNWKKSVLLKKSRRYGASIIKPVISKYSQGNTVLCNSFPKSGTHLLEQVLSAQGLTDYGEFLASTPSLSMKEKPETKMIRSIARLVPGEFSSGHLHWSDNVEKALADNNILHFFIFRDPRDVVVSECYYLSKMNKWHKLHRFFAACASIDEMIKLSICGIETDKFYFPDIGTRMKRYSPWINNKSCCSISYENLFLEQREHSLGKIFEYWNKNGNLGVSKEAFIKSAEKAINPGQSHTFRAGGAGKWVDHFSSENLNMFFDLAGEELIKWGYTA